jgi:chromate transporter
LLIPDLASVDLAAVTLAGASMLAMLRYHLSLPKTLAAAALLGMAWKLLAP